jgi:Ketopantoate reductase
MKLLFIGAGPIGCLYAGKLALSGNEVALVARGERLAALREKGLSLVDAASGREERAELSIVDAAEMADSAFGLRAERFDAAILAVRSERLALALPDLAAAHELRPACRRARPRRRVAALRP